MFKKPIFVDNEMSIFCILAESGRGRQSMAENADGSNGTIVPFVTYDHSRRDNEMCWLLDGRSLTNPPDWVISSPKTKGTVIPQVECSWWSDMRIRGMFHRAEPMYIWVTLPCMHIVHKNGNYFAEVKIVM